MFLVCKNKKCPYWYDGFCGKDSIGIDEVGMCNVVWNKGRPRQVKPYWNDDGAFVREGLHIIEAVEGQDLVKIDRGQRRETGIIEDAPIIEEESEEECEETQHHC